MKVKSMLCPSNRSQVQESKDLLFTKLELMLDFRIGLKGIICFLGTYLVYHLSCYWYLLRISQPVSESVSTVISYLSLSIYTSLIQNGSEVKHRPPVIDFRQSLWLELF